MNKVKAFTVTVIVAAMLALILVGAYRMYSQVFTAVTWVLAAVGYLCGANFFRRWLERDCPMLPAGRQEQKAGRREERKRKIWEPDEVWDAEYQTIKDKADSERPCGF